MAYGCEQYPGFFTLHSLGLDVYKRQDNGRPNKSRNGDAMDLRVEQADLVYIDCLLYTSNRMFMMYSVNDTPNLHFATAAGKIGNGLDEQLENFMREHSDTKLIIIDTMQKIREVGGEAYSRCV